MLDMIDITFPDGSVKAFEKGVTAYEIAQGISPRLAAEVLAATVVTKDDPTGKGTIYDLDRPINVDASVRLHKWEDDEAKKVFWHSSSHLMAEALEALYPGVKFGIGPAIENGFYYDVDFGDRQITEADLKAVEDKMMELARQNALWNERVRGGGKHPFTSPLFDTAPVAFAYDASFFHVRETSVRVTPDGRTPEDADGRKIRLAYGWRDLPGFLELLKSRLLPDR